MGSELDSWSSVMDALDSLIEMLVAASLSLTRVSCLHFCCINSSLGCSFWVGIGVRMTFFHGRRKCERSSPLSAYLVDYHGFFKTWKCSSHFLTLCSIFFLLQTLVYVEWAKIWIKTCILKPGPIKPFILNKLIMLKVCDQSGWYSYLCPSYTQ